MQEYKAKLAKFNFNKDFQKLDQKLLDAAATAKEQLSVLFAACKAQDVLPGDAQQLDTRARL